MPSANPATALELLGWRVGRFPNLLGHFRSWSRFEDPNWVQKRSQRRHFECLVGLQGSPWSTWGALVGSAGSPEPVSCNCKCSQSDPILSQRQFCIVKIVVFYTFTISTKKELLDLTSFVTRAGRAKTSIPFERGVNFY